MVRLICSDALRERLERELEAHGILCAAEGDDGSAELALVERGFPAPDGPPAIVFDALDHMDVVRLLVSGVAGRGALQRTLVGQRGEAFVVVPAREIVSITVGADGLIANTASGPIRVRGTLQQFETSWGGIGFFRANRSELVNLAQVREIVPWFNSRYVLRLVGERDIEVSRFHAKRLRDRLGL